MLKDSSKDKENTFSLIDTKTNYKLNYGPIWTILTTILIVALPQIIALIIFGIYFRLDHMSANRANNWFNSSVQAQFIYVSIIELQSIGAIAAILKFKSMKFIDIGFCKIKLKDLLYTFNGFLVYMVAFISLTTLADKFISGFNSTQKQNVGFQSSHGISQLTLTFISLVILPPIAEEIIFRGYLFSGLRTKLKFIYAAIITSILFAMPHLLEGQSGGALWIAGLDTFVLSMVLCYLRDKTNSLWPGIFLHALKNGIAFVSLFSVL